MINDVNTADITHSASNSNIDVCVCSESKLLKLLLVLFWTIRAAGLFGHGHNQVSGLPNQLSNEHQISPEAAGINSIVPYSSEVSSSSAGVSGQTLSFTQSSFNANVDAAKSGFISAAIPLHSRVPMKT